MHGIGAGGARRGEDGCNVQVTLGRRRGADVQRLVGLHHVQCAGVGIAVHRHGAVAQAVRRANDAAGDLATVGDEDLAETHCGTQAALRFCKKASVPSVPSAPSAVCENTSAACCTIEAGA